MKFQIFQILTENADEIKKSAALRVSGTYDEDTVISEIRDARHLGFYSFVGSVEIEGAEFWTIETHLPELPEVFETGDMLVDEFGRSWAVVEINPEIEGRVEQFDYFEII